MKIGVACHTRNLPIAVYGRRATTTIVGQAGDLHSPIWLDVAAGYPGDGYRRAGCDMQKIRCPGCSADIDCTDFATKCRTDVTSKGNTVAVRPPATSVRLIAEERLYRAKIRADFPDSPILLVGDVQRP